MKFDMKRLMKAIDTGKATDEEIELSEEITKAVAADKAGSASFAQKTLLAEVRKSMAAADDADADDATEDEPADDDEEQVELPEDGALLKAFGVASMEDLVDGNEVLKVLCDHAETQATALKALAANHAKVLKAVDAQTERLDEMGKLIAGLDLEGRVEKSVANAAPVQQFAEVLDWLNNHPQSGHPLKKSAAEGKNGATPGPADFWKGEGTTVIKKALDAGEIKPEQACGALEAIEHHRSLKTTPYEICKAVAPKTLKETLLLAG